MKKLPDELIRTRPVLSTQYAWALWLDGKLEAREARLRDAERWLDPTGDMSARPKGSASGMVVVDEEQFRTLPASIALARDNNAQARGDFSGAVKHIELALKLIPEQDLIKVNSVNHEWVLLPNCEIISSSLNCQRSVSYTHLTLPTILLV